MIPFISAALIYWNRDRIFRSARTSVVPGASVFIFGGIVYYAGRAYGLHAGENEYLALMTLSLIVLLLGGFLFVYGSVAFKTALFPLIFLSLAIPIPERILSALIHFLQHGSANMVSVMFALTGTPVYRKTDVVFALPRVTIEVAEACSGIRSTLGMWIVTLLASHLFLKSNWRKTVLLIAVIPVSLFKNAVRIVTLTLLALHWDMSFLDGSLHRDGGVVFMAGGLCLMYPVLWMLMKSEEDKSLHRGAQL